MIFVSQSGQPAITIFDNKMTLKTPMNLRTWNGNLMFKGEDGEQTMSVFYRRSPGTTPLVDQVSINVPELIRFLGHTTNAAHPATGMGMTYSQTIGAIYALSSNGFLPGSFKVEQDRIIAAIAKAGAEAERTDRPEFIEDESTDADQPSVAGMNVPGLTPRLGTSIGPGTSSTDKNNPNGPKTDIVPR